MQATENTPARQRPRGLRAVPGALWLVFGLLAMNFTVVGVTIYLVSRDTHFAVEPDYYQRAVEWDASKAELARSAALGWNAALDVPDARSASGNRTLTIRLTDRDGQPITGANIDVVAFHHGSAAARFEAVMVERGAGIYQGEVPLRDAGLHEVRLIASRDDEHFVTSVRQDWKRAD
ncbi:MAG: FixH family protein [Phycisphaeraceae bacterium]|nr:MAG: FixH family protein [Phycisphaeraceae bacterium]